MTARGQPQSPLPNAAFFPDAAAEAAPELCGTLHVAPVRLRTHPELAHPWLDGRDARLFPGITLAFVTLGDIRRPHAGGGGQAWRGVAERGVLSPHWMIWARSRSSIRIGARPERGRSCIGS